MTANRTIVEEVLNDTMLVVWERAATFNHQSKVSTWIFAIAYRTALKALHRHDEPMADPADEPIAEQPGPEQHHVDGETRAALANALGMLSSEHRSALVLTYFHEPAVCGDRTGDVVPGRYREDPRVPCAAQLARAAER